MKVMTVDQADARTPRDLVRLLLLTGLVAVAFLVIGFFTSSQARAAEAPPSGGLLGGVTSTVGKTVSGVTGAVDKPLAGVGSTAGKTVTAVTGTVDQVTRVAPPVHHVVAATTPVVAQTVHSVQSVTAAKPVAAIVAPVAKTVDSVVAAVPVVAPVVHAVAGSTPVATIVAPVASGIDDVAGTVGDSVGSGVDAGSPIVLPIPVDGTDPVTAPPVTTPVTVTPVAPGASLVSTGTTAISSTSTIGPVTDTAVTAFPTPASSGAASAVFDTLSPTTDGAFGAASTSAVPSASQSTIPANAPTGPTPQPAPALPAATAGSATGQAGTGSGAATSGTVEGGFTFFLATATVTNSTSTEVPSSPTYDSDSTPD